MDLFVSDSVETRLKHFKAVVDNIEVKLAPVIGEGGPPNVEAWSHLERAQWHMLLASTSCKLYELFLKAHGQNPALHEKYQKEKKRVAQNERRVAKAVKDHELATTSRSAVVNVAAANRFIDQALPDLTADQKASLRQMGKGGQVEASLPQASDVPQGKKQKKRKQGLMEIGFLKEMLEDVKKTACGLEEAKGSAEIESRETSTDGGSKEIIEIDGDSSHSGQEDGVVGSGSGEEKSTSPPDFSRKEDGSEDGQGQEPMLETCTRGGHMVQARGRKKFGDRGVQGERGKKTGKKRKTASQVAKAKKKKRRN